MEYAYTPRFVRSFKRLPQEVQEDVLYAVDAFKKDRNAPSLRLHKLSGSLKKYHAFSANFSYRVIVHTRNHDTLFMNVGDHDMYT